MWDQEGYRKIEPREAGAEEGESRTGGERQEARKEKVVVKELKRGRPPL